MNNFKKVAVVAALVSASTAVFAANAAGQAPATNFNANNMYVEGNFGVSKFIISVDDASIASNALTTIKADAGYKFTPNIAAEAGFGYIFNQQSYRDYYPYLAAKLMLPFANQRANVNLKVGISDTIMTAPGAANITKFGAYVGIGAGYNFTQNIGVNIDMSGPMFDVDTVNFYFPAYTLGLSYSF